MARRQKAWARHVHLGQRGQLRGRVAQRQETWARTPGLTGAATRARGTKTPFGQGTFTDSTGWSSPAPSCKICRRRVLTEATGRRFTVTYAADCKMMDDQPTPATKVRACVCPCACTRCMLPAGLSTHCRSFSHSVLFYRSRSFSLSLSLSVSLSRCSARSHSFTLSVSPILFASLLSLYISLTHCLSLSLSLLSRSLSLTLPVTLSLSFCISLFSLSFSFLFSVSIFLSLSLSLFVSFSLPFSLSFSVPFPCTRAHAPLSPSLSLLHSPSLPSTSFLSYSLFLFSLSL